jgi:hypothetical protein
MIRLALLIVSLAIGPLPLNQWLLGDRGCVAMNTNANGGLPRQAHKTTRFRQALYIYYLCLGFAGALRLMEGNQSVLGVVSSVFFILGGVVSGGALAYGYFTGRLP